MLKQSQDARPVTLRSTKAVATGGVSKAGAPSAQGFFNFESITEEVSSTENCTVRIEDSVSSVSVAEQVAAAAKDYQLQMQSYALALRELLPADVKINSLRATLHFIDPKLAISLAAPLLDREVCARAIDEAMLAITSLDGTIEAELFPPKPATHCRLCNFLDLCSAGREWLRLQRRSP